MKYTVVCRKCDPKGQFIAECRNFWDAQTIAQRHDDIRKGRHIAEIETLLETPHEGLLQ